MKRFEMKQVTEIRDVLVEHTCDWCGKAVNRGGLKSMYDVDDFECSWRTGESYPEGGSGPKIEIDLCRDCRPRFFTMLEAQGIKVQKVEWDT